MLNVKPLNNANGLKHYRTPLASLDNKNDDDNNNTIKKQKRTKSKEPKSDDSDSTDNECITKPVESHVNENIQLVEYQPIRCERYVHITLQYKQNEKLFDILDKLLIRKGLYFSWFEDGNGLPDNCVVMIPQGTSDLILEVDAPRGWVRLEKPTNENKCISIRVKFTSTKRCGVKTSAYKDKNKNKKFVLAFKFIHKFITFDSDESKMMIPELPYIKSPADTQSKKEIGQCTMYVDIRSPKNKNEDVYAHVTSIL